MLLKDIIEELDLILPNPYTDDEKVVFINKSVRELKRYCGKTDVFRIVSAGLSLYPLPAYISGEDIRLVSVEGREMPPKILNQDGDGFYYLIPQGFLGFEPAPRTGELIEIVYASLKPFVRQNEKSEFLYQELDMDDEWRAALIYGTAADIAAATEDVAMSNNLRAEFNALKLSAMQGKYRKAGKYPVTKIVDN